MSPTIALPGALPGAAPGAPLDPATLAPTRRVDSDQAAVVALTMQTDVFYWHGCTEIWIDGAWRKAPPAFKLNLRQRFGLLPLGLDGLADSIYHPFDAAVNRHMAYAGQRGSFNDVALGALVADCRVHYPNRVVGDATASGAAVVADVDREART